MNMQQLRPKEVVMDFGDYSTIKHFLESLSKLSDEYWNLLEVDDTSPSFSRQQYRKDIRKAKNAIAECVLNNMM